MTGNHYEWAETFRRCYDKAVAQYKRGNRTAAACFNANETAFLAGIGCAPQELYDFAEDWCADEVPSFPTVLLIAAARRDYFISVQRGRRLTRPISTADLPDRAAELAGFAWLPRIIAKARAKLRGQMPPDLMYCCGGDRAFLERTHIHPADFLRVVWSDGDDNNKIVAYVRRCARRSGVPPPHCKRFHH